MKFKPVDKIILSAAVVLFCTAAAVPAENAGTNNLKTIFSLETRYLLSGIQNNGWGLGFSVEQKIFNYFSIKGTFLHTTFTTDVEGVDCTSVGLSLFANYYPFGRGLDLLYMGTGSGIDFLNYFEYRQSIGRYRLHLKGMAVRRKN
jgi:hypothetical protein